MSRFDSAQRSLILQAAVDVFANHGLGGAAIRLVGKAAGVNSALIYYYFENKQSLFVESLQFVVKGLLDTLAQQRCPFHSARDRLSCLVNGVFDYFGSHPGRMKLMVVAFTLHSDLFGKVIEDLARQGLPLPLDMLREGIECGQLKAFHPVQVWWCILGCCLFNLHMLNLVGRLTLPAHLPLPDPLQARRQVIEMLCDGLAADTSNPERKGHD